MDLTARNALVVENLPLVGYLVNDMCARATHLSRDDLASVGALALISAAEAFDATLGVPFGAYARRRIIGAFADDMRSNDWASRDTRRRIRETLATQETLTATLGRHPDVDELAAALGVDRAAVRESLADASRVVTALDDSASDILVADIIAPETALEDRERDRYLRAAVAALPETMRWIVEQLHFHDRTVGELAAELGITHSAVSQQRSEAMRMLHDGMVTHYDGEPERAVQSRVSAARRASYLSRVAEYTAAAASTALPHSGSAVA